MTTQDLINTIRACKTSSAECNAALEQAAVQDFLGGPAPEFDPLTLGIAVERELHEAMQSGEYRSEDFGQ